MATFRDRVLQQLATAPVLDNGQTMAQNQRGEFSKGFDIASNQMKRGVYGTVEGLGDSMDSEALSEFGAAGVQNAQNEATTLAPLAQQDVSQVDWSSMNDVLDWTGGALGQVAPSVGMAVGAGALAGLTGGGALAALGAASLPSFATETGNIYTDVKQETGIEDFGTAAAGGAGVAALDTLGLATGGLAALPARALSKMVKAGIAPAALKGSTFAPSTALRRIGASSAIEGSTEAAQGVVADTARAQNMEGIDPLDFNKRLNEFAIGALAGGTMSGAAQVGGALTGLNRKPDAPKNPLDVEGTAEDDGFIAVMRDAINERVKNTLDPISSGAGKVRDKVKGAASATAKPFKDTTNWAVNTSGTILTPERKAKATSRATQLRDSSRSALESIWESTKAGATATVEARESAQQKVRELIFAEADLQGEMSTLNDLKVIRAKAKSSLDKFNEARAAGVTDSKSKKDAEYWGAVAGQLEEEILSRMPTKRGLEEGAKVTQEDVSVLGELAQNSLKAAMKATMSGSREAVNKATESATKAVGRLRQAEKEFNEQNPDYIKTKIAELSEAATEAAKSGGKEGKRQAELFLDKAKSLQQNLMEMEAPTKEGMLNAAANNIPMNRAEIKDLAQKAKEKLKQAQQATKRGATTQAAKLRKEATEFKRQIDEKVQSRRQGNPTVGPPRPNAAGATAAPAAATGAAGAQAAAAAPRAVEERNVGTTPVDNTVEPTIEELNDRLLEMGIEMREAQDLGDIERAMLLSTDMLEVGEQIVSMQSKAGRVGKTWKLDGQEKVNLEAADHIVQQGDGSVNYSRGLQWVERAFSDGSIEGELSEEDYAAAQKAIKQARNALELSDKRIIDPALAERIKKALDKPPIRKIFDEAAKYDDFIKSGEIDTTEGYNEAVKRSAQEDTFRDPEAVSDRDLEDASLTSIVETSDGTRYIFSASESTTEPLTKLSSRIQVAAANGVTLENPTDGVQRNLDLLKEQGLTVEAVPYAEAVKAKFLAENPEATQAQISEALATEGKRQWLRITGNKSPEAKFSIADLYDSDNKAAFLDNFTAFRELRNPSTDDLALPSSTFKVAKTVDGVAAAKAVFKPAPRTGDGNPEGSNVVVTLNGKRVTLNIMNLINKFRDVHWKKGKTDLQEMLNSDYGTSLKFKSEAQYQEWRNTVDNKTEFDQIREDFSTALSSLLNNSDNKVALGDIQKTWNSNLVVFRTADGENITLQQILNPMSPAYQVLEKRTRLARVQQALEMERGAGDVNNLKGKRLTEAKERISNYEAQEQRLLRDIDILSDRTVSVRNNAIAEEAAAESEAARDLGSIVREDEAQDIGDGIEAMEIEAQRLELGGGARTNSADRSTIAAAGFEFISRFLDKHGLKDGRVIDPSVGASREVLKSWNRITTELYEALGMYRPSKVRYVTPEGISIRDWQHPRTIMTQLARHSGVNTAYHALSPALLNRMTVSELYGMFRPRKSKGPAATGEALIAQQANEANKDAQASFADMLTEWNAELDEITTYVDEAAAALGRDVYTSDILGILAKNPIVQRNMKAIDKLIAQFSVGLGLPEGFIRAVSIEDSASMYPGYSPVDLLSPGFINGSFNHNKLRTGQASIFINPLSDPHTIASTVLHEFSHALTSPFLYDTNTANAGPLTQEAMQQLAPYQKALGKLHELHSAYLKQLSDKLKVNISLPYSNVMGPLTRAQTQERNDLIESKRKELVNKFPEEVLKSRNKPLSSTSQSARAMGVGRAGDALNYLDYNTETGDMDGYFTSFEEWLADQLGQDLTANSEVREALRAFFEAQTDMLFDTEAVRLNADTTAQSIALVEAWLPNTRKLAQETYDNMGTTEYEGSTEEINFAKGAKAVKDMSDPVRKRLAKLVKDTLGISLDQLASEWYAETPHTEGSDRSTDIISKLVGLAYVDAQMADSQVHTAMMRYALKHILRPKEKELMGRVATNDFVMNQIKERIAGTPLLESLLSDPATRVDTAIALAYRFHTTDPTFKMGKAPTTLFEKVREFLRGMLRIAKEEDGVNFAFEFFNRGERSRLAPKTEGSRNYFQNVFGADKQNRRNRITKAVETSRKYNIISAAQTRIRDMGNPVLEQIGKMFSTRPGEQGIGQTYFEERQEMTGKFMARLHNAMNKLDDTQTAQLMSIMHNFKDVYKTADQDLVSVAADMFEIMHDMRIYLKDAGLDVGKRGAMVKIRGREIPTYVPWKFSQTGLMTRGSEAIQVLMRPEYRSQMAKMAAAINNNRSEADRENLPDATPEEAASTLIMHIIRSGGMADISSNINEDNALRFSPSMSAMMKRDLWWLMEDSETGTPVSAESKQFWTDMFENDPTDTFETYIDQGVKRAAFTRRFGEEGSKLETMLNEARDYGATPEQLKYTEQFVQAMLGSYGQGTQRGINKVLNKVANMLGQDDVAPSKPSDVINPKFSKFNQVMMTYQNIRLLDFAMFTSLIDPAGIAVRSGSIRNAWHSFKAGINATDFFGGTTDQNKIRSVAELLGIAETYLNSAALEQEYGGNWMNGRAKKANEALFKYSGLSAWTRTTRLMAVSSAMQFLKFHVATPEAVSSEYLSELGLKEGDLTNASFDEDGHVKVLTESDHLALRSTKKRVDGKVVDKSEQEIEADMKELARDKRVRNAILRYTNQAILRPNASQRPVWASDPHFALVFHLKQFMWSFVETILAHSAHRAKNGDYVPLMLMGTMYPVGMAGIDALRDLLRYGDEGAPSMRGADWTDYAGRALSRSGILGYGDLAIGARTDMQYGGLGIENLVGPSVSQGMSLLDSISGDEEGELMRFLDRATPLQNTSKTLEHWTGIE